MKGQGRTPISIITGYLGSGKTTLLRRILSEASQRIAVVMNEFGELGVDGKVIQGKDVKMMEISGGCVCCSLVGEFEAAVREIIKTVKPELIVVETTGLAEPESLLTNIQEALPELRIDSMITIVDSYAMVKFPSLGHTGTIQIEIADMILMNKADLVSGEEMKDVERKVASINGRALTFKTIHCNIHPGLIFGLERKRSLPSGKGAHEGLETFQAFSFTTKKRLKREKFEAFASSLSPLIYRAKGFVRFEDGEFLFNYVAGRSDFEEFSHPETEIVFIGDEVEGLKEEVLNSIEPCLVE